MALLKRKENSSGDVVPFPKPLNPPSTGDDQMNIDLSGLNLIDDLTDVQLQNHRCKGGPTRRQTRTLNVFLIGLALLLFTTSVATHFISLDIADKLRFNPDGLDYDGLVAWHTNEARRIAHFGFASRASFAVGLVISAALALFFFKNNETPTGQRNECCRN